MRVIVAGALANKPRNGGEAWVRLSWIRGLQRLGCDVTFIEQIAGDVCTDATGAPANFADSVNLRYFDEVTRAFGLEGNAALLLDDGREIHGSTMDAITGLAAEADLLVNISGHLTLPGIVDLPAVRAYIDIDPGFTQFWLDDPDSGFRVPVHDLWFTIGENIGASDCAIPTAGLDWQPVRQPVVLADWESQAADASSPFTTIASWRGAFGPVEAGGRRYGVKVHEFRKVMELPLETRERLRIALDIHPGDSADREMLEASRWELVDPRAIVPDPDAFRDFVRASKAEFSVAQGIYVDTNSGWFSDRTTRYLAAGRPAVVQDTGFGRNIPVGRGLLTFRTQAEALAAIEAVTRDYEDHARSARDIAREHFDSDRVLARFLDVADSAVTRARRNHGWPTVACPSDENAGPDVAAGSRIASHRGENPNGGGSGNTATERERPGSSRAARLRILVSGMLAGVPGQGGATWAVLQYVLGLLRLGHDVMFVEPVDASALQPSTDFASPGGAHLHGSRFAEYLDEVAREFALEGRLGMVVEGTTEAYGIPRQDMERFARTADLLINLSGVLREPALFEPPPVRVYVDLDPAFTQLWQARQGVDMRFDGHTHFLTVGLSIGTPGCAVPTCGLDWRPIVQPVVLDHWSALEAPARRALTSVANWRGYGSIEMDGVLFGQKAHSLRELIELPARSAVPIELALAIHPDETRDLSALERNGWTLLDPACEAATPARYRAFIQGSWAELGVAKSGYVHSKCGWFSDRSICYLAAGRPVIVQDTGFGAHLPTGEGIVPFSDVESAATAIKSVQRDYPRHARAARRAAELIFDSDTVLSDLLEKVAA